MNNFTKSNIIVAKRSPIASSIGIVTACEACSPHTAKHEIIPVAKAAYTFVRWFCVLCCLYNKKIV